MKHVTENYASVSALARYCAGTKDGDQHYELQSVNHPLEPRWCLNTPYSKALDMAQHGGQWPEGARDLQSVNIDEQAHTIAKGIQPTMVNDVVGGALDIPEYLQGASPEVFMRMNDDEQQAKPVVRVGVCIIASANVDANTMMNRSRAVLALLDALELQGYSTELDAIWIGAGGCPKVNFQANIRVKNAGQPWDASSAAFALAHPAVARRLGFRLMEFNDAASRVTESGYGNGHVDPPAGYDLYFPYLSDNDKNATPEKSLKYVTQQVKQQKPDLTLQGS